MKSLGNRILFFVSALGLVAGTTFAAGTVTGSWDFDDPSNGLKATVGADLVYGDAATAAATQFGTTTSFGIADIGGQVANVMKFPQTTSNTMGYMMYPGAEANGSTADVNQYTLIMDIMYPAASSGMWRCLFQTSATNSNDGDFFVNRSNGIGISGQYHGEVKADTWHRVALVVDLEQADATKKYVKYIDGVFVGYTDLGSNGAPGGRFAVWPASSGNPSWVFADEDGETATGFVNSLQFRNYAATAEEIAALGGPTAGGIVPEPTTVALLALGLIPLYRRNRR